MSNLDRMRHLSVCRIHLLQHLSLHGDLSSVGSLYILPFTAHGKLRVVLWLTLPGSLLVPELT